jgi:DNA-binding CsgD family transcriptional regulator
VLSRAAFDQTEARIGRICDAPSDARGLRIAVVNELRAAVPFQAYAWLMTDPDTYVGSSPLADVPCLPELPTLIRLKYLTEVNRWTKLPDTGVARLHTASGGDLSRSLLWDQMLRRFDIVDVASMAFSDRFGCWAFLDLWRARPARPFGDDEAALLARLVPPLTAALRRRQAATFTGRAAGQELTHADPAVLLLSSDLTVQAQTSHAEQYLRLLLPPAGGRGPVPAGAYNVAAQLLARESGVDDHPPRARVHIAGTTWLTLQAARIRSPTSMNEPEIAVTLELATPADRADIFARAQGLTDRETDILNHVLAGADTRDLAHALHLSEHTVQDHFKAIFAKTGSRSRRQLLGQVVGTTS